VEEKFRGEMEWRAQVRGQVDVAGPVPYLKEYGVSFAAVRDQARGNDEVVVGRWGSAFCDRPELDRAHSREHAVDGGGLGRRGEEVTTTLLGERGPEEASVVVRWCLGRIFSRSCRG